MREYEVDDNTPCMVAVVAGVAAGVGAVQAARTFRAWTREGLAIRAGVMADEVYRTEAGHAPSGELQQALARALGVPTDMLAK
jgi:transcriptional regulator with XRE-family HTH domain